eukprot:COSAG01_NODE_1288_length_10887_cov_324.284761_8_plen_197_part_00
MKKNILGFMLLSFLMGYNLLLSKDINGGVAGLGGYERYDFNNSQGRQKIRDVGDVNNELMVRGYKFTMKEIYGSSSVSTQSDQGPLTIKRMLVFPNPYSQSLKHVTHLGASGGKHKAILGYELSKDASFELMIYNMLGRLVYKRHFPAGVQVARAGYNTLALSKILGNQKLSTGIYFAYMVHDKKVLAQTKFGVKP